MSQATQKIQKETAEADLVAAECQLALEQALPALVAAEEALNVLTKKDIAELKVRPKTCDTCVVMGCVCACAWDA